MNLFDYDFHLPEELIALRPREPRGNSKLLVVEKKSGKIFATNFNKILDFFSVDDLFIFNNTKVLPASLTFEESNKKQKVLLVEEIKKNIWKVLTKNPKEKTFKFQNDLSCKLFKDLDTNDWLIEFNKDSKIFIDMFGMMPIPPYLNREPDLKDFDDYQTVYADVLGSIAAPTAGLHFTEDLIKEVILKKIGLEFLTLHVGLGTFLPVKVKEINNHKMHKEKFYIGSKLINSIEKVKRNHGRVLTVGTTTLRALEASMLNDDKFDRWFETDIFIKEGFDFKLTDALLTNFHLPKSTLLILVSSFLGHELTMDAYNYAVKEKFNFFSYGDAMLII